jgi:hypothetical protein
MSLLRRGSPLKDFSTGHLHFRSGIWLLKGAWIATATSLALGNIDIDQAVVSTIAARIAAAKVTLKRMTPTSGSTSPAGFHFRARRVGEV